MTWGKRLIPVLLFAFALGGYIFAFVYTMRGDEARTWPAVQGVVGSSEVGAFGSGSRTHGPNPSYFPLVTYEYSVNGTSYQGNDLALRLSDNMSKKDASARLAPYPVGKSVQVFYDPSNPSEAVLETGWDQAVVVELVGLATLAFFFGLGTAVELRRQTDDDGGPEDG